MTNDLVDFIRARLDEDEQVANAVGFGRIETGEYLWGTKYLLLQDGKDGQSKATTEVDSDLAEHITRHDPARVLAEVAAKRRMVELHRAELVEVVNADRDERSGYWCTECDGEEYPCRTLRLLAAPYATHPDYLPEWAPTA